MQAPDEWEAALTERMVQRGDTKKMIDVRKKLIEQDIADLCDARNFIQKQGEFFIIQDDTTIERSILPWLKSRLPL